MTSAQIKAQAARLGFDAVGIAPAAAHPELAFFREWLDRGYAAGMSYLHRTADRRSDVRNVLPSARSVIVTATVYHTDRPYSVECADPDRAQVARYAWGEDYHDVIGRRLDSLLSWMRETSAEAFEARGYVDTGPVQERVYAQYGGIGWIGKNTCVINPVLGSWIFLAEIICSLALEADAPAHDQCGTCTLCIEACPTQALTPGVLDSNKCISYLTIEHKGSFSDGEARAIGAHVYGCDICQEVCPWNAVAPPARDPAWQPRALWDAASLKRLSVVSDDELQGALAGSAMRRAKVEGLRRNVRAALDNSHVSLG